jgi:hypothetical protein
MEDLAMLNIKWLGKIVLAAAVTLTAASPCRADEYVHGYYRSNGTYVQPYFRSDPDGNPYNNYSYPGNLNPYTGQVAPGNPDTYLRNYYDHDREGGSSGYGSDYGAGSEDGSTSDDGSGDE